MSEKDRFEMNDDMAFDSDTDGQHQYDDFEDPLDGFADYDDMSGFEDLPEDEEPDFAAEKNARQHEEAASSGAEEGEANEPVRVKTKAPQMKQKRSRGLSPIGMGPVSYTHLRAHETS